MCAIYFSCYRHHLCLGCVNLSSLRLSQKHFRWLRVSAKWYPCTSIADKHQWDKYYCDPWHDWRRPAPYNIENCCTCWNIVWECSINYFRWFGLRKVSRRWASCHLTEDQKSIHLSVCERLLVRYRTEICDFLILIVMIYWFIIATRNLRKQA